MRRKLNLKEYALWLLGCRDYTVKRLREKCVQRYPEELNAIEILINKFIQEKYLDDARFCEVMIRTELQNGNGQQKICSKLMQKGIESKLAKQKCAELIVLEDQLEPARLLVNKKRTQIERKYPDLSDYEQKGKLTQYLAGRGYSYDVIKEVLSA